MIEFPRLFLENMEPTGIKQDQLYPDSEVTSAVFFTKHIEETFLWELIGRQIPILVVKDHNYSKENFPCNFQDKKSRIRYIHINKLNN